LFNDHGCGYPVVGQINHKLSLRSAMNQRERKAFLIGELQSGRYGSSYEVLNVLEGHFSSLEAVPFGLRNQPTRICEDLSDGRITREQSVAKLIEFLWEVPDDV